MSDFSPITDIKRSQSDKNSTITSNKKQTQEQSQENSLSATDSFEHPIKLQQNAKIQCQKCSSSNYGSSCIKSENNSIVLNRTTEIDNSIFLNNQIKLNSFSQSSIGSMRNLQNQEPNVSGQLTNVLISNSKISRFHLTLSKREQCQISLSLPQQVEKSGEISSKQSKTTNTESQREIVQNSLENSSKNTSESYCCQTFQFQKRRINLRQPSSSDQYSQSFSLINVEEIEPYIFEDGSPICKSETVYDLLKEINKLNVCFLDREPQSFQSQRNVCFQMQSFIQSPIIVQTMNSKIEQSYQQSKNPNQCPKKRKKIKKKNKSSYLANQRKYMNEIRQHFQCSEMIQLSNIDFLSTENIQMEISSEYTNQLGSEVCEWQTQTSKYSEKQNDYQMECIN